MSPADTPIADLLALAETLDGAKPVDRIEQTAMSQAAALLRALASSYIVLLLDPDGEDSSPWPVVADSPAQAIEKARADYRAWDGAPETDEPPPVVKVYRGTLSERVMDF